MPNLESAIVDKIVQACFNSYKKLPKNGKPVEKEWTVLSSIVKYDKNSDDIDVVSLGTGSKCIGANKMSPKGDIINDSHAEVFARRGFLLYLYENVEKVIHNRPSILTYSNGKYKLQDCIELIFYASQMPCGDASIIPKGRNEEQFGDILPPNKRKGDNLKIDSKRLKLDEDIHRTGAKCLPESYQDPKAPGSDYHVIGQVRTKPGRGDRTLSVSCSDKIARWIHLGIQGSLLHMICGPIFIKHFIFGGGVPYSEETLSRALFKRNSYDSMLMVEPKFYQTSLTFSHIRSEESVRPASGSIVWIKLDNPFSEVAVQGKKLGVTKKKEHLPNNSLCISKYNIYHKFINILSQCKELKQAIVNEDAIDSVPYNKMKQKSTTYLEEWSDVKEKFFKTWTVKPNIWDFCINAK